MLQSRFLFLFNAIWLSFALNQYAYATDAEKDVQHTSRPYGSWHFVDERPPWLGRSGHAMFEFHGKLWVVGGTGWVRDNVGIMSYHEYGDAWCSRDGIDWTQITDAQPWKMWWQGGVVSGSRIWVSAGTSHSLWYSTDGAEWTRATSSAPWCPAADMMGNLQDLAGSLWMVGGCLWPSTSEAWFSQDGTIWTEATGNAPWSSRSGNSLTAFADRLWLMGGGTYTDLNDVWSTTDGANWTEATPTAAWRGRGGHAATAFEDQIWLTGGAYSTGSGHSGYETCLNDIWHSTDGVNWTQEPNAPWSVRGGHAMASYNGRLWISGGSALDGISDNDLWCLSPVSVAIGMGRAPSSQVGDPLTLTLSAQGFLDDITCQWLKNGTAIPYATTETYHVDHLALTDVGDYRCQVTDMYGFVFTTDAFHVAVAEKVPAASPVGLALGVCLTASVLVLRQRKSLHRSR